MKKKLALTLALVCAAGMLTGCFGGGNNSVDNTVEDNTNLHVYVLNRGYGTKWLKELEKGFEAKNSGIDVHIKEATDTNVLDTSFKSGKAQNDYDLYFSLDKTIYQTKDSYENYGGLDDLSDLYTMEIPGEGVTFGDKMTKSVKDMIVFEDGKYYSVPWATGTMGIIYNEDVIKGALGDNYQLPRTTTELAEFAASLKAANSGIVPFVYPGQLDQWSGNMVYSWWAQYAGKETYDKFFEAKIYDELQGEWIISNKIFEQKGRVKALEVLDNLISVENGWSDLDCNEYGQEQFKTLQIQFLDQNSKYAMYPCGDWLEQESADARSTKNFALMKTPVISSIVETLNDKNMTDATLRAVVDAVDKGESSYAGVSAEDFARIKEARSITYSKATEHQVYAPAYSNAKKLARQFLLYMASDEGIKIYKENVNGGFLPFEYDYSGTTLSKFETSVSTLMNGTLISQTNKSAMFYRGNVSAMGANSGAIPATIEVCLSVAVGSKDALTPTELNDKMKYSDAEWNRIKEAAGL